MDPTVRDYTPVPEELRELFKRATQRALVEEDIPPRPSTLEEVLTAAISAAARGEELNLSHLNLFNMDFRPLAYLPDLGLPIPRMNLEGANVSLAKFDGLDMSRARMANVRAYYASFKTCIFDDADMNRGKLIGCDLSATRLLRVDVNGLDLSRSDLHLATISDTRINRIIAERTIWDDSSTEVDGFVIPSDEDDEDFDELDDLDLF